MKALYGFNPELRVFQNQQPEQHVQLLQFWDVDAVFGGYQDMAFLAAAQAAGLKVYAEFGCFQGVDWWNEFPESRPVMANGSPLPPVDWYHGVNPSVPEVRQLLLERLRELLTNYPIDGIWLDFIRWSCRWENKRPNLVQTSFDHATMQRFMTDTGTILDKENPADDILTKHFEIWTAWKCEQIRSWVAEARRVVDAIRPEITLGLFGIPWLSEDFDGAIRSIIGQDFQQLAVYIDVFSPMTYHRMCYQSVDWIESITAHFRQATRKQVVPIIQSMDEPDTLPLQEYRKALKIAQTVGDGVIVFTLEGMLTDKKLAATQQAFGTSTWLLQ